MLPNFTPEEWERLTPLERIAKCEKVASEAEKQSHTDLAELWRELASEIHITYEIQTGTLPMDEEARSAKGYKACAPQIRAEAENISYPETKQALLNIAANYEQLARRVPKSQNSN